MKSNSTITTNNANPSIRNPSTTTKLSHHLSFLNGTPSQMVDSKISKASFGSSSIGGIRRSFMFKSNQNASPKIRAFNPKRSHSNVSHLPQPEQMKLKVFISVVMSILFCRRCFVLLASLWEIKIHLFVSSKSCCYTFYRFIDKFIGHRCQGCGIKYMPITYPSWVVRVF